LGYALKCERKFKGISLDTMAIRMNVSRPTIIHMERGSTSLSIENYILSMFILDKEKIEKILAIVAFDEIQSKHYHIKLNQ
jgi:predicted transcriptional regulator